MAYPLIEFQRALVNEFGRTAATAGVYASNVRQLFKAHGATPTSDEVISFDQEIEPARRGSFRTAWRSFVTFAKARGVEVPLPAFPDGREDRHAGEPVASHPIARPVARLGAMIAIPKLVEATWLDVSIKGDQATVTAGGRGFVFPADVLIEIARWAFPEYPEKVNRRHPLVPEAPGSKEPMAENRLRRIVRLGADQEKRSSAESTASAGIVA